MKRRALLFAALLAPVARLQARLRWSRVGPAIELRGGWILKKGDR